MTFRVDLAIHPQAVGNSGALTLWLPRSSRRTGAGLLIVMIGIFLIGVFAASMLQSILQRYQVQQRELRELQCQFLLESGMERARAQLALDPAYLGERWWLAPSLMEEITLDDETGGPEPQALESPTMKPQGLEPRVMDAGDVEVNIGAEILIEVLTDAAGDPRRRMVRVTAHYPFDPLVRIRTSREFPFLLMMK